VLSGNFNMGMGEKFDKDAIKPDASWDLFCNACWDGSFCLYDGGDRDPVSGTGPYAITYINPEGDPRNNSKK
jgi:hypothetical protein